MADDTPRPYQVILQVRLHPDDAPLQETWTGLAYSVQEAAHQAFFQVAGQLPVPVHSCTLVQIGPDYNAWLLLQKAGK